MFPKLLTSRLQTILGPDYNDTLEVFAHERKGSFRINLLKSDEASVLAELESKSITVTPFAGIAGAYLFEKKDDYALKGTDAFYSGNIYLQSISSMLPVLVLAPKPGESILDVCAAPGSKTTQMAMIMGNEGKITALEQNPIRFDKLMHNAVLQGVTIVEWKKVDARVYLDPLGIKKFDKILLDAPCSAEGRITLTNDKTYWFWSLENIKKKANVQYDLLSRAILRLETWGTLVYSTCTLAPEENEWIITRVLAENPDITLEPIDIGFGECDWWKEGITKFGSQKYSEEMKKAVRILPSEETEGFFVVKLVRKI